MKIVTQAEIRIKSGYESYVLKCDECEKPAETVVRIDVDSGYQAHDLCQQCITLALAMLIATEAAT